MEPILNALLTGIAVFISMRLNRVVEKRIEEGRPLSPWSPVREKAEFLPPMNDEEYDTYMDENSGHGELTKSVLAKMPWNLNRPKSPSSDSSSKTEL